MPTCPCGHALPYERCCGRFHRGEAEAPTAEALMRSRYAAFVRLELEYLFRTLHPDNDERMEGREAYLESIRRGASQRRYRKLEILETRGADAEGVAVVLFAVTLRDKGRDASFVELSRFVYDGAGWRYLFGTTRPRDACPKDLRDLRIEGFERASQPQG